jgi:hypothetical protein
MPRRDVPLLARPSYPATTYGTNVRNVSYPRTATSAVAI